ncbi:hypothetical protein [Actinospongicola halichondriae]|uniref:hypothetical protein n=1 Tax=Actinospongicola halichondriae TaxID=3236844 RepID=UPI003D38D072
MTVGPLERVVHALRPYWAAEAEICRAHLARPDRSVHVDVGWLARQAAKELIDGVVPRIERVRDAATRSVPPAELVRETAELHEEAAHFAAFADAHDVLAASADLPPLGSSDLGAVVAWPANAALADLRAEHCRDHGRAGELATSLTEGGCSALFAVGVELETSDDVRDQAIAQACRAVLDDEVEHLRSGLDDLVADLASVDVDLVIELAVAQSQLRLQMRQLQMGSPVTVERMDELAAGGAAARDLADVDARLARSPVAESGADS